MDRKSEAPPPTDSPRRPVTVITGCSRGLGQALAEYLAVQERHTVVATMRDVSAAAPSLSAAGCHLHALDVTSDASVAALASYLQSTFDGVDVVVSNAGYGVPGSVETIPLAQQQAMFDTNTWAVVRLAQALFPLMRARGGGVLLAVSSISGIRSFATNEVYGASKAAMEALLEGLRYSVARDRIRIAVVNPGPVHTSFAERLHAEGVEAERACVSAGLRGDAAARESWVHMVRNTIRDKGQTGAECSAAITAVLRREWAAVCEGKTDLATFWNGTDQVSQSIIDAIKSVPDGRSGLYATLFNQAQERLDALHEA